MEEKQNKQNKNNNNNNNAENILNELHKQEQNIKQEQKNELQESFLNNNIPIPPPLPSPIKNSLFIRKNANQIENNTVKNSINNIIKDEKNSNIGKVLIPKGLEDKLSNIYCINNSTEKNNNNKQNTKQNIKQNNNNNQNNNNQNNNNQNTSIKTNIRNNDQQNNISYNSQNNTSYTSQNNNSQNINNLKIEVSDESLQQIVQCVFKNETNNNNQNNNSENKNTQNINDITPIENNINRYENRLVKNREELLLLLMGVFIGIFSSNYKFFIP